MKRTEPNLLADAVIASIIVILVCLAAALGCGGEAYGACPDGTICSTRVDAKANIFTQPILAQPVQYQVGGHLQQQASATYQFRHSEEYQQLQFLKGFYEGVQSQKSSTVLPVKQAAQEPLAGEQYTKSFPTIVKHCASCHSGDNPKAGLWLDGSVDLRSPEAAAKRDKILRSVYNGTMPKNKGPLDDATFGSIFEELYAEPTEE